MRMIMRGTFNHRNKNLAITTASPNYFVYLFKINNYCVRVMCTVPPPLHSCQRWNIVIMIVSRGMSSIEEWPMVRENSCSNMQIAHTWDLTPLRRKRTPKRYSTKSLDILKYVSSYVRKISMANKAANLLRVKLRIENTQKNEKIHEEIYEMKKL